MTGGKVTTDGGADALLFVPPTVLKPGDADRVATWGKDGVLNRQIVAQLRALTADFREDGIDWTFGREQEFTFRSLGNIDQEALRNRKITALTPLLDERMQQEGIDAPGRLALTRAFTKMPLQEVCMTELHLRLKDELEPRFGKGAKGFYDPQGVLEASTRPTDPVGDVSRWHKFTRTLQGLAEEYDYALVYYKRDITFKATDRATGQPVFATSTDADLDGRAAPMAGGILRAVYDALPCLIKELQITDHIQHIDMGHGRHHAIRSQNDRLEMRTNHNPMAGAHPALENLLVLAGARYGLAQQQEPATSTRMIPCEYGDKTVFTASNTKLFFLTELLNAAEVKMDGTLRLPNARLVMKYSRYLEKELQLKAQASVSAWINSVKVTSQGIQWPDVAAISTAPELLSRELAKITHGAQTRRLKSSGYIADQGLGATPVDQVGRATRMLAAIAVMGRSDVLNTTLGQDLTGQIVQAFAARYEQPPAPTRRPATGSAPLDRPAF
jgi:hypothetical protein